MNTWAWMTLIGFAMLVTAAAYVRVRWKRAPTAFRALSMLGIVFVLAGVLIGYSANHLLSTASMRPPLKSADSPPDPVVTDGKIPALDVRKSIVLMDENIQVILCGSPRVLWRKRARPRAS